MSFINFYMPVLLAILFSFLIVIFVKKNVNFVTIILALLFFIIFYLIFSNQTGTNLAGSLPFATYPNPPNLGLDGISQENRYSASVMNE
jgi:predicted neutral ceramidase superfamily lipid hydrolase